MVGETRNTHAHRAKQTLDQRLHDELSVYWRLGKAVLPEHTERQINMSKRKEALPEEIQMMSRSRVLGRTFDEKLLYRIKLKKERNQKRYDAKLARRLKENSAEVVAAH